MQDWIISKDVLATPVTMTMRKRNKIGTFIGGLCSIILIILGFLYSFLLYYFNFVGGPIYESEIRPLYLDVFNPVNYTLDTSQVNIGFKITTTDDVTDIQDIEDYFYVYFKSHDTQSQAIQTIKSVPCSDEFYGGNHKKANSAYFCPDTKSFSVGQNQINDSLLVLTGVIDYCSQGLNTETCQSNEDVDKIIRGVRVQVLKYFTYFDPRFYDQEGVIPYAIEPTDLLILDPKTTYKGSSQVNLNDIYFYNNWLLDVSGQEITMLENIQTYYFSVQSLNSEVRDPEGTQPLITYYLGQGIPYNEIKWVRNSLEVINANIGGIISFMVVFIAMILSPHQDHVYEQNLVSNLYTTEPTHDGHHDHVEVEGDQDLEGELVKSGETDQDLIKKLEKRIPISMSFADRLITSLCCLPFCRKCINEQRFMRKNIVEQARKLVNDEIDVFSLVQTLRVAKFLHEISLKTNQRMMVRTFEKYHFADPTEEGEEYADDKNKKRSKRHDRVTMSEMIIDYDGILQEFKPDEDGIDQLIYQKIVGSVNEEIAKSFYRKRSPTQHKRPRRFSSIAEPYDIQ